MFSLIQFQHGWLNDAGIFIAEKSRFAHMWIDSGKSHRATLFRQAASAAKILW